MYELVGLSIKPKPNNDAHSGALVPACVAVIMPVIRSHASAAPPRASGSNGGAPCAPSPHGASPPSAVTLRSAVAPDTASRAMACSDQSWSQAVGVDPNRRGPFQLVDGRAVYPGDPGMS